MIRRMSDTELFHRLESQAHVWLESPGSISDPSLLSQCRRLLSQDELARHRRYRFTRDRHVFLVSHALLRCVLSRYVSIEPSAWRFENRAHGRPEISARQDAHGLRFNLSHTNGLVACVVTRHVDCGVDVENITRQSDYAGIAGKMFSAEENRALEGMPAENRVERFYSLWTLKEAYVKARGLGLSMPTRDISFSLDGDAIIAVHFGGAIDDDARQWQFELARPSLSHRLALALRSGQGRRLEPVYRDDGLSVGGAR